MSAWNAVGFVPWIVGGVLIADASLVIGITLMIVATVIWLEVD